MSTPHFLMLPVVEAGGKRFAIPRHSVTEILRVRASEATDHCRDDPVIERIGPAQVLRLRDRLLPIVALDDLLRLGGGSEGRYVVVVQTRVGRLGILVDRVFDTEEIVVKPLAPILRHITLFDGNTILGDGSVIMILNSDGVARAAGVSTDRGNTERDAYPGPTVAD